ncbi:MAG: NAD(P)/FAD-dependent oxidoreductase [Verrucomicrobiota bacterium]
MGGGAAGFFAAISLAEYDPEAKIVIFEKSRKTLSKVKVSGGGRCNVTHSCFDPKELSTHYPRGRRELLGAFHSWQPRDTIEWFAQKGIELKTEADGRMFPTTDDSSTIINCFRDATNEHHIETKTQTSVSKIETQSRTLDFSPTPQSPTEFTLHLSSGQTFIAHNIVLCTGGTKGDPDSNLAAQLGHTITPLAPSLFTFHIDDPRLNDLQGLSVPRATVTCRSEKLIQQGPVLITHWGLSGPGVLKLSAWGARNLAARDYKFEIELNWLGSAKLEYVVEILRQSKNDNAKRALSNHCPFDLPKRLWNRFLEYLDIKGETQWAQLSKKQTNQLAELLVASKFQVDGKSMNKEEFVTCGGVKLTEVNLKTMESKKVPGLHFAGEVLDIDGITGGFNFQAAWTTARLAARHIAEI